MSRGSEWRRWDLHIHTKGTNKNDNYSCKDMYEFCNILFKKALEKEVWAIGITDYFSTERYKEVKAYQDDIDSNPNFTFDEKDKIRNIFLLPNVELRMLPTTDSGRLINIHCIFNPEYEKRLDNDFFSSLLFKYRGNEYKMNRQGFIDLGKALNSRLNNDDAYKKGIQQFSISLEQLQTVFEKKQDLRENTLIAVSNSNNDGASGLRKHYDLFENEQGSLDAVRKSIYYISDCIFSSNINDHDYFLGKRSDKPQDIIKSIRSLKPCIHGSDAHTEEKLFEPDDNRCCWIKAELSFNGLKQILYEPEERVKIQSSKPDVKNLYQVIDNITLNENGFWRGKISLNPNLNTIIGGRSTGKSSLLKAIAAKHNSDKVREDDFIRKHLNGVSIQWQDGNDQLGRHIEYFPQNYMHDIAHDEKRTNEVIENIIRQKDRGALLKKYEDTTTALAKNISDSTFKLFQLQKDVDTLNISITEKGKKEGVEQQINLLKALISELQKNSSLTAEEKTIFDGLTQQLKEKQNSVQNAAHDLNLFDFLQNLTPIIPNFEDQNKFRELSFGLNQSEAYRLFQGLRVRTENEFTSIVQNLARSTSKAKLVLEAEIQAITNSEAYKKGKQAFEGNKELDDLTKKLHKEESRLSEIKRLEGERAIIVKQRDDLLNSIVSCHSSVKNAAIEVADKLPVSFDKVEIGVNLGFKKYEFREFLESRLNMRGNARQNYIEEFVNNYSDNTELRVRQFLIKLLNNQIELKNYNTPQNVATEFLSSNWFQLNYTLSYQDDSFKYMSEGKQAFVILKLLLDFSDTTCPILIDQPEDSLDNRAIYNELVNYIKKKKRDRQIILVTHNSNVVVSADAENIIIANQDGSGAQNDSRNKFQYVNGALEETKPKQEEQEVLLYSQGIREHVCEILEGGKDAFEKREKKYGFKMR